MHIQEYPICCGAKILVDFYPENGNTKEEVNKFLEDAIKQYEGNAFLLIILHREERRKWHKTMIANDFHIMSEGKNRAHNNSHLTLYVRNNPIPGTKERQNYD